MSTIAIIGAGSFGTALATVATKAGHQVVLWGRDAARAATINATHTNEKYLPGVTLDASIHATSTLSDIEHAHMVIVAVPAQTVRAVLPTLNPWLSETTPLVIGAKGLEQATGARLDEIVHTWRSQQAYALLSGPGFDTEIAAGLPTAVAIASPQPGIAEEVCRQLSTSSFRPYAQDDVAGVALAGALKNPLAIGAGVIAGAKLGENARAAFITRGLAEITRLGVACGAQAKTFMGLAGVGDVFLTCASERSRNYRYGVALASGGALPTFTVEGLPTIAAAHTLGQQHHVELPLMDALYRLAYKRQPLAAVLQDLLARPLRSE